MLCVLRVVEERFHRDEEDRPIREGRTPPELLREGEIEYRRCPHAGSRHLHANPMNVSALKQMSIHWDELVDALAFLRAAYAEARGRYDASVLDIWRVSQLGSALPWFYILRDPPRVTPAFAAALSKATLGMGIWAQALLEKSLVELWAPPVFTPANMLALAEATETLIGESEVCSAPEKMLLKYFDVHVTTTPAFSTAGRIGELVAARDDVMRFGAHYIGLKLTMWIYYLARRFLYADIAAAIGDVPPPLRALIDASIEPPDFFTLEPPDLAQVSFAQRAVWFQRLAAMIVPLATDRSDGALHEHANQIAQAMGEPAPPQLAELAAEVERVVQPPVGASERIARAVATYARLDALFAESVGRVESAFRAATGNPAAAFAIDAATRDRLLGSSPRRYVASLAPHGFAALAVP